MLKRSKLLVAFLVVTVICASIGFAAISDTLTGTGTLDVAALGSEFDKYVKFSETAADTTVKLNGVDAQTTEATAEITGEDKDTLTITVESIALDSIGDKIVVTAKILNTNTAQGVTLNGGTETVVATLTGTNVDSALTIGASLDKTALDNSGTDFATLTVTIEMVKLPADAIDNASIALTITAEPTTT